MSLLIAAVGALAGLIIAGSVITGCGMSDLYDDRHADAVLPRRRTPQSPAQTRRSSDGSLYCCADGLLGAGEYEELAGAGRGCVEQFARQDARSRVGQ
jgi:hypothetical protein